MRPYKMIPAFKDYIWGGCKLVEKYGKETDIRPVAESWELSCHKDGLSYLDNGISLKEYIENNKGCLGTNCITEELPILIKLIDAQDNLSVQVHPNDDQAKEWENQNGKTEMWYVAEVDEDAKITCGFKKDVTKDELKSAIEKGELENLLEVHNSKKGDVFFVEAGTVHAIGKGNLIIEIQQNSNVTYRLYDYNRKDKNGNLRELHIEKGIMASNCNKFKKVHNEDSNIIASCKYFEVRKIEINGTIEMFADDKSYNAVVVADGEIIIEKDDCKMKVCAGETVFVPAGCGDYIIKGNADVLVVANPYN